MQRHSVDFEPIDTLLGRIPNKSLQFFAVLGDQLTSAPLYLDNGGAGFSVTEPQYNAPANVQVIAGNGQMQVSWDPQPGVWTRIQYWIKTTDRYLWAEAYPGQSTLTITGLGSAHYMLRMWHLTPPAGYSPQVYLDNGGEGFWAGWDAPVLLSVAGAISWDVASIPDEALALELWWDGGESVWEEGLRLANWRSAAVDRELVDRGGLQSGETALFMLRYRTSGGVSSYSNEIAYTYP